MRHPRLLRGRAEGDALVISFLVERVNDFQMADRLGRELRQLLARHKPKRLVLDFERTEYVISEVFTLLLQIANQLKRDGAAVVACNLTPFLRDIYATMKFDSVIPVYPSPAEALKG